MTLTQVADQGINGFGDFGYCVRNAQTDLIKGAFFRALGPNGVYIQQGADPLTAASLEFRPDPKRVTRRYLYLPVDRVVFRSLNRTRARGALLSAPWAPASSWAGSHRQKSILASLLSTGPLGMLCVYADQHVDEVDLDTPHAEPLG